MDEVDGRRIRGGPWCRCTLPASDRAEIKAVAAASSRDAVRTLAGSCVSLSKHLSGESYYVVVSPPPGHADCLSSAARPPVVLESPSRSGTRRSGRSGRSNWVPWRAGWGVGSDRWPSGWDKHNQQRKRRRNQ